MKSSISPAEAQRIVEREQLREAREAERIAKLQTKVDGIKSQIKLPVVEEQDLEIENDPFARVRHQIVKL